MIRRLRSACIGAALMGALALSVHAVAKPPELPEDGSFEVLPMPHEEADVTCPFLRQQTIDRHACQLADPEIGRDVLANLERLKQADDLLNLAKELAQSGLFTEAMECCACAVELCPGSPCANRAADAMFELALGFVSPSSGSEEAAEPPPEPSGASNDYEFEIGTNAEGGLRMGAVYTAGSSVYHLRYNRGSLTIWKTSDAGKTKP